MEVVLAAGAAGLAAYALGKRRERRQIANGYVTYHGNGYDTPQYANVHYGKTGNHYGHTGNHYGTGYGYQTHYATGR